MLVDEPCEWIAHETQYAILMFDQEHTFQLDGTAIFCATTQHEKQRIAHITEKAAVWPMAVVRGERSSGKGDEDGATTCQEWLEPKCLLGPVRDESDDAYATSTDE